MGRRLQESNFGFCRRDLTGGESDGPPARICWRLAKKLIRRQRARCSASGRPLGSARLAIKADQSRRSRNGHRRVALVAVAEIDGNHSATPTIRAAAISMKRASARQQGLATLGKSEPRKRNKAIRRGRFNSDGSRRDRIARREAKDHSVGIGSDDAETRTRRGARECGQTAHP
jgi:hypothetical protein